MLANHIIDKTLERVELLVRGVDLEVAEAYERGRDAAHHGAGLGLRVAVVEHVADHDLAGRDQAERARGRYAEPVHRLAAQEFAQRRAQHGAAIGGARIGRLAGALELQLLPAAVGGDQLAERDGAAVAELPGPVAELVAAVARG